jgi:hypothetical protein
MFSVARMFSVVRNHGWGVTTAKLIKRSLGFLMENDCTCRVPPLLTNYPLAQNRRAEQFHSRDVTAVVGIRQVTALCNLIKRGEPARADDETKGRTCDTFLAS